MRPFGGRALPAAARESGLRRAATQPSPAPAPREDPADNGRPDNFYAFAAAVLDDDGRTRPLLRILGVVGALLVVLLGGAALIVALAVHSRLLPGGARGVVAPAGGILGASTIAYWLVRIGTGLVRRIRHRGSGTPPGP